MDEFTIKSYSYNDASFILRTDIAELLNVVWSDSCAHCSEQNELPTTHRAELSAQSFCAYSNGVLVGYAAVIQKNIMHCGLTFRIAGISSVATHPTYRGHGIGSGLVATATQYIQGHTSIDVGIFTCHPDLALFYKRAGDWDISPQTIVCANQDVGALSSKSLNVVVLLRFFSEKSYQNKALFYCEPINLGFLPGEFL